MAFCQLTAALAVPLATSRRNPAPRWPRGRDGGERSAFEAHTLLEEEAKHHVFNPDNYNKIVQKHQTQIIQTIPYNGLSLISFVRTVSINWQIYSNPQKFKCFVRISPIIGTRRKHQTSMAPTIPGKSRNSVARTTTIN